MEEQIKKMTINPGILVTWQYDNDDPKQLKELESKTPCLRKGKVLSRDSDSETGFNHFVEITENSQAFTINVLSQTITLTPENLPQEHWCKIVCCQDLR